MYHSATINNCETLCASNCTGHPTQLLCHVGAMINYKTELAQNNFSLSSHILVEAYTAIRYMQPKAGFILTSIICPSTRRTPRTGNSISREMAIATLLRQIPLLWPDQQQVQLLLMSPISPHHFKDRCRFAAIQFNRLLLQVFPYQLSCMSIFTNSNMLQ